MALSFSQRIGRKTIRLAVQTDSMDSDLRTSLWNVFFVYFFDGEIHSPFDEIPKDLKSFLARMWFAFLKGPINAVPESYPQALEVLHDFFELWQWYEVYDFIEFVAGDEQNANRDVFVAACNAVLERELSGYRMINYHVSPITDAIELSAIEDAVDAAGTLTLTGVKEHLDTAQKYLSDRESPDYRNSIKESISAVESLAILIAKNPKASLSDALRVLENSVGLHGALRTAYSALYGYTSDESGIRHAILEMPKIDFADAKYMLVACSAFVYYLIDKGRKANLL